MKKNRGPHKNGDNFIVVLQYIIIAGHLCVIVNLDKTIQKRNVYKTMAIYGFKLSSLITHFIHYYRPFQ